jgi:hypothetical protein
VGGPPERPRGIFGDLRAAWSATGEMVEALAEALGMRRVPWWVRPLRVLFFLAFLAMLPFRALLKRRWEQSPEERLRRHADEVWRTSPYEALAIVRAVYDKLERSPGAGKPGGLRGAVLIEPYGKFGMPEHTSIQLLLYDYEFALGHFEAAREVIGPPTAAFICLRHVDCLLGMNRRDEAIALLRASLHLDGAKQTLEAKLAELEGSARGGLN